MASTRVHPRLGDREGLRIDILPLALLQYRTAIDDTMSDADARAGLLESLRDSYVIYSSGETMRTRWRSRSLDTDLIATLTRVRPDHVRCHEVEVRGLRSSEEKSGRVGLVHRIKGRGSVRVNDDGSVSWRDHGSSDWRAASMQALARDYDAEHDVWAWLRRHNIRRPSPSGPSGEAPEADREHAQCKLRLHVDDIARLDQIAEDCGVSRSELVRRWIKREG